MKKSSKNYMIEKYWAVIRVSIEFKSRNQKLQLQELANILNSRGFTPQYGGKFTGAGRGVARLVSSTYKFALNSLVDHYLAAVIASTITDRFDRSYLNKLQDGLVKPVSKCSD